MISYHVFLISKRLSAHTKTKDSQEGGKMKKNTKKSGDKMYKTVSDWGGNALKKPVVRIPESDGKRPGNDVGLPEDLRVMHAEERNPHDG
jgi:hypothetical protein